MSLLLLLRNVAPSGPVFARARPGRGYPVEAPEFARPATVTSSRALIAGQSRPASASSARGAPSTHRRPRNAAGRR